MLRVEAISKATGRHNGPWFFSSSEMGDFVEFVRAWQGAYTIVVTVQDA